MFSVCPTTLQVDLLLDLVLGKKLNRNTPTEKHSFYCKSPTFLTIVIVLIAKVCHRDGETYLEICGT